MRPGLKRTARRASRTRRVASGRPGFSLVEIAVATALVGIALSALLVAVASGTRVNEAGKQLTQASFLAQEIREWTSTLPFSDPDPGDAHNPPGPDGSSPQVFVDDLDDLMGVTYSPPRNGRGQPITSLAGWSQTITLTWRNPNSLTTTVPAGSSDIIHVQVDVAHRGNTILTTGWLVTRRQ